MTEQKFKRKARKVLDAYGKYDDYNKDKIVNKMWLWYETNKRDITEEEFDLICQECK